MAAISLPDHCQSTRFTRASLPVQSTDNVVVIVTETQYTHLIGTGKPFKNMNTQFPLH